MAERADLLVIGGGPGGYAAAFRAADLGREVTIVSEEEELGGVCLLRGCIPSKALLSLAELMLEAGEAGERGVSFGEPQVDLERVRAWKASVVGRLTGGLARLAERRGIRRVQGRARFRDAGSVEVEGAGELTFRQGIVATGSRPTELPAAPFGERVLSSAGALDLADVPQRLLVVGGGYVGLELGMVYACLGSRVTLVEMTDRLLPAADPDLVEPLARRAEELFEGVHRNTKLTELEPGENEVRVVLQGEAELGETVVDRVLVAVGRRPNSDDLGLESTAVDVDERGFVVVDEERRTAEESIFAIGDVAGGMMLAHEAMHEGRVAAEVIAGQPAAFDRRAVPAVVYTDPQVAWCGLTESQAAEQGLEVEVGRFPWQASGRAVTMGASAGLTKVIGDRETGQVLGVGVIGRGAESLIAEGALALEMGAVIEDLALTVHPHPTLSETLGEAAETLFGGAIHRA